MTSVITVHSYLIAIKILIITALACVVIGVALYSSIGSILSIKDDFLPFLSNFTIRYFRDTFLDMSYQSFLIIAIS